MNTSSEFHKRFSEECKDMVLDNKVNECGCNDDEKKKKKNPLSFISQNIDGMISWLRKYPGGTDCISYSSEYEDAKYMGRLIQRNPVFIIVTTPRSQRGLIAFVK
ncbi:hypothetical protein OROMI_017711 [Orobanche minor]